MTDYIAGKRPVVEALRSGFPLDVVYLADNLKRDGLLDDIERKARAAKVPVKRVPRKTVESLVHGSSNQGVVAQAAPFSYASLGNLINRASDFASQNGGRALLVVLDHITDAGNLGAIVRSAEAVGASGVIIPQKRSAHVTTATYKSSAGAIAHMPVCQVANLTQAIARLKDEGFWVAGASEHSEEPLWKADLKGKLALAMGSEDEGISRLVGESCDFFLKLPQLGAVSSLNVAQAATVCMYEWLRQNLATSE